MGYCRIGPLWVVAGAGVFFRETYGAQFVLWVVLGRTCQIFLQPKVYRRIDVWQGVALPAKHCLCHGLGPAWWPNDCWLGWLWDLLWHPVEPPFPRTQGFRFSPYARPLAMDWSYVIRGKQPHITFLSKSL